VRFHFSTVVWGPWHTGVFLDVNLPSLLAPNNLAAFGALHDVTYRILTSPESAQQIEASPAFQLASRIVKMEVVECEIDRTISPIAVHHQFWRRSMDEAMAADCMLLFVPPDVIWSDGALKHVAELVAAGKRAVFMTYVRVAAEDCIAEVRKRHLASDGVTINASPRTFVGLAMEFIHPLALTYLRDSKIFPVHPELVLWSVPGEGMLMRVLVREMFAFDPKMFPLNQCALPSDINNLDLVHFITDSDDLFALSLAPLHKDTEWFTDTGSLSALKLAFWWLVYDSPMNDIVARLNFYIHKTDRVSEKWRRAEIESDALVGRVRGMRNVLRALNILNGADVDRAIQVATMALIEGRLALLMPKVESFIALLPSNDAVFHWALEENNDILRPGSSRRLANFVMDHCVIGGVSFRPGEDCILTTVRGRKRQVTWTGNGMLIDGVPAIGIPQALNDPSGHLNCSALLMAGVLPEVAAR
jgi:hypothetical protein